MIDSCSLSTLQLNSPLQTNNSFTPILNAVLRAALARFQHFLERMLVGWIGDSVCNQDIVHIR